MRPATRPGPRCARAATAPGGKVAGSEDCTDWSTSLAGQGKALALVPGHVAPVGTGAEHDCAFWAGISG